MSSIEKNILLNLEELQSIAQNFHKELTKASSNLISSINYLQHKLPKQSLVKKGERYLSLSIGGSTIISAETSIDENNNIILHTTKTDNLGLLYNKRLLFETIEMYFDAKDYKFLTLNFAYPLTPTSRNKMIDGIFIKGTKEHQLEDLRGNEIGKEIELYFETKLNRDIKVSVANDTICLLLSGIKNDISREILVGGVIGTGVNFAIFDDQNTAINLESGNFNKFNPSEITIEIDDESSDQGEQLLEKEIAGAYLYKHYNKIIEKYGLPYKEISSTAELNKANNELALAVFEKSASLVAAKIKGIYDFKKQPNLIFIMEGSLFWKCSCYKPYVEKYLDMMGILPENITFKSIENSNIVGSAHLIT